MDASGGQKCPGEEGCSRGEAGIHSYLQKEQFKDDPEEACTSCPLVGTKPGGEPASIAWALKWANRWERKVKMGLRITNPDDLTPMEWAACEALQLGRDRWQEVLDKRMKEKE